MDKSDFEAQLRRDGYLDIKTKSLDPGTALANHSHKFDTRLLVLGGEIIITYGEQQHTYCANEILEIERDVEHSEHYGAGRFEFIVGLRHKPVDDN